MTRLHITLYVAAILSGLCLGFLLTASTSSAIEQIATTLAASLANALVAVLAIAVSAMTLLAGGLVVADVRADFEAAQAWQKLDIQAVFDHRLFDAGAAHVEGPYELRPEDEQAQRTFLAFRLSMPGRLTGLRYQASLTAKEAAEPAATDAASIRVVCRPVAIVLPAGSNSLGRAPAHVANNPNIPIRANTRIGRSRVAWQGGQVRRVANAGRWLQSATYETRSATTAVHSASVIVLADVSRGNQPSVLDVTAESSAPSETTCRGPPLPGGRSIGKAGNPPPQHDHVDVVDNLGRPTPVGVAELSVIESFLGDVLNDVLAASGAA